MFCKIVKHTNSGEDCGCKVEGTGELPLNARLVGHRFDDHSGEYAKVLFADVVLALEHVLEGLQGHLLLCLVLRLKGVKDSRSHEQVSEGAHNQG